MHPKSTQRLQKSSPRRPRCSQDGLLEPTWAPKCLPRSPIFLFFAGFWCQMLPRAPQDAQDSATWSKESPQEFPRPPLDLDFNTILNDFWWNVEGLFVVICFVCFPFLSFALRCLTGSTSNQTIPPHTKHTVETILLYRHGGGWCEAPRILYILCYILYMIYYILYILY